MNNADAFWLGCLAGMGFIVVIDWLFKRALDIEIAKLKAGIKEEDKRYEDNGERNEQWQAIRR